MARRRRTDKPKPYTTDLAYIQDEMAWVETRCLRLGIQFKLDRMAGDDPDDTCHDSHQPHPSPFTLQARLKRLKAKEGRLRRSIDKCLGATRKTCFDVALDRLQELYGLDAFERTLVLLTIAPTFTRRAADWLEALDAKRYGGDLNVETAFSFLEVPFKERIEKRKVFSSAAPLFANDVLELDSIGKFSKPDDLLSANISITGRTFAFVLGDDSLSEEFLEFSSLEQPKASLEQVVLPPDTKRRILAVVDHHDEYLKRRREWGFDDVVRYGRGIFMLFHGASGTGKTMTAHAIADHLEKKLLCVDIPTFLQNATAGEFFPGLFREGRLRDAILFFDECESIFASRQSGNQLMTLLLTEMERFEGIAIMATNLPAMLDEALDRRILVKVRFPEPDIDARIEIWRRHLPDSAPLSDDVNVEQLANRFDLTGGLIKNAVLAAVAESVQEPSGAAQQIRMSHLEQAAVDQTSRPLDGNVPMVMPKARLSDVVLPPEIRAQVEELIDAARNRATVLSRWGIGTHLSYGKGLSALLSGPSGTGKTLCAEAIAAELNIPLLSVPIQTALSKWVGQAEKNLAYMFNLARTHRALLLLDEADSLLKERGKDGASRHDDSLVNTLLTLIERHDGVVLLTTNLVEHLDPALARRLTCHLRLPFPDAEARTAIWKRLLPSKSPTDGGIDFVALGRVHRLSGAHIKNAVFRAAFRAAREGGKITQEILEDAARQESVDFKQQSRSIGFAGTGR